MVGIRSAVAVGLVLLLGSAAAGPSEQMVLSRFPGYVYSNSPVLPTYSDESSLSLWTTLTPQPGVGDLNGDGFNDIVLPAADLFLSATGAAVVGGGSLIVCLNDGSGAFIRFLSLGGPDIHPTDVALADMNLDGHLDVIGLRQTRGCVAVWLGTGTGEFKEAEEYAIDTAYFGLEISDVNQDLFPDVVVVGNHSEQVPLIRSIHVLLGVGDGALGNPIETTLPSEHLLLYGKPWRTQVADFTGEGCVDLAFVAVPPDGGCAVLVAQGNGSGRFDAGFESSRFDFYPSSTTADDFDGDGIADLAISHRFDGEELRSHPNSYDESSIATILFGGSDLLSSATDIETGISAMVFESADFDSNGRDDLVAFGRYGVTSVIASEAGRAFDTPALYSSGGADVWTGFVGEFTGDGKLDVGAQLVESGLVISAGNGLGGVGPLWFSTPHMTKLSTSPNSVPAVADFDNDGNLDVVYANSRGLGVGYGAGTGFFSRIEGINVPVAEVRDVVAVDFDHDRYVDLIVGGLAEDSGAPLHALTNNRSGGFEPAVQQWDFPISEVKDLSVADLDGNGRPELVVSAGSAGLWRADVVQEAHHDVVSAELLFSAPTGVSVHQVKIADIDGDRVDDLAFDLLAADATETVVMLGRSTALLGEVTRIPGTLREIADFNADGVLDVSTSAGEYLGAGTGLFEPAELGFDVYSAFDIDGDGCPEVVFAFERSLLIRRSLPDGGWTAKVPVAFADGSRFIRNRSPQQGDFNGDGRTDLILPIDGGLSVLLNTMEMREH